MRITADSPVVTEAYRQPVVFALVLQSCIAILSLLALDGGLLAKICGVAMMGFWLGVGMTFLRRPFDLRFSDEVYIRFGFLPLFALVYVVEFARLA